MWAKSLNYKSGENKVAKYYNITFILKYFFYAAPSI